MFGGGRGRNGLGDGVLFALDAVEDAAMGLMDQIERIASELPESQLAEVRDFAEFLRNRQRQATGANAGDRESWQAFFVRHGRTVENAQPLGRDEIYADRLS